MIREHCYNPDQLLSKYLTAESLDNYFTLLMEANETINLVSRETSREHFNRMVCESILPLDFLNTKPTSILDVGSGGGLPAIPLMLAGCGFDQAVLVERRKKKSEALRVIVERLKLIAEFYIGDFGEYKPDTKAALITVRYVRLTSQLLKQISRALKPNGYLIYYSTPDFEITSWQVETYHFTSPQEQVIKSFTILNKQ